MPSALTYPGVYVEEIPSGVRTITGVATSITAFIGWAPKGPTEEARRIHSFLEYERVFGGTHASSWLGYAVRHFFDNGGSDAYVLRLAHTDAVAGKLTLKGLELTAKNEGDWSKFYAVNIKHREDDKHRFSLAVVNFPPDSAGEPIIAKDGGVVVESFENLSMNSDDYRYVEEVIREGSALIEAEVKDPKGLPDEAAPSKPFAGGKEGTILEPGMPEFRKAITNLAQPGSLLDHIDLFNLLCVPGLTDAATLSNVQSFCQFRRAFLIADCDPEKTAEGLAKEGPKGLTGATAINAAYYFPWVNAPDPLSQNRPTDFPPCGMVAGIYARTDATRGVWKAPAGTEASLTGALGPKVSLTDNQNGDLNVKAINCIRNLPVYGTVLWGARTLHGDNERGSEWKYVPVRRTALFIEETLFRNLKWVVFEPNDEPLWAQIRLNVGAFMHDLFRQHAFQGLTPREAYFVKCDRETTTQNDINLGIVNILVGFAPLKPAEFIVIKIQQIAGQIET